MLVLSFSIKVMAHLTDAAREVLCFHSVLHRLQAYVAKSALLFAFDCHGRRAPEPEYQLRDEPSANLLLERLMLLSLL
jgi:hypothetical protein